MLRYSLPLPPELIIEIAELLLPSSCYSFASTCHTHWILCQSLIQQHAKFSKEYAHVSLMSKECSAWDLFNSILETPLVGTYLRLLALSPNGTRGASWNNHGAYGPFPKPLADIYISVSQCIDWSYKGCIPLDQTSWSKNELLEELTSFDYDPNGIKREEKNDGVILPILIHLLPELQVLRLGVDSNTGWLLRAIWGVAEAYKCCPPVVAASLPLQNLTTVALMSISLRECTPDWAILFQGIPSVRYFAARGLHDWVAYSQNFKRLTRPGTPRAKSGLKEMLLVRAAVDSAEAFAEILRSAHKLERFGLEDWRRRPGQTNKWHMWKTLADCTGQSLEHLVMEFSVTFGEVCQTIRTIACFNLAAYMLINEKDIRNWPDSGNLTQLPETTHTKMQLENILQLPSSHKPRKWPVQ